MIVVMRSEVTEGEIAEVISHLEARGLTGHLSRGEERTVIGVIGRTVSEDLGDMLETLPGVETIVRISKSYKLASREFKPERTLVQVGDVTIGGEEIVVMAGPCAVESEAQTLETAGAVAKAGARILRGGAFKPRTSPYQFRGLGEEGLRILATAREETGLKIITEVLTPQDVELVARYADILQIGARNMQNYLLLEEVGKSKKPVMLKRGLAATVEEWLLSAEYILSQGNHQVMLCERGIRTYETATRNTMDISAIPVVKGVSHLPVIADPSHGTGKWYLVAPMSLAAVAAGADGIMMEVHPTPDHALADGSQSLKFDSFSELMPRLAKVAEAVGRRLPLPVTI
ncbi:MAG: 3-deoxy-7-phosphoheptulonate synthase [Chloroflexi bacterium]|nr:3-deoxy-7-phosphoheptulonate synthase [Chloroflexota bacterium]